MNRTLVLDVVGLDTGAARACAEPESACRARRMRPLTTVTPAVTTTVQSTFVTGALPREHGIVANGWYFRDLAEVWLLAPVQPPGRRREDVGCREAPRPGVHLRQAVLVVQHVRGGRLLGHAAADVSGRRPQAARRLHAPGGASRRAAARARARSRCSASGGPRPDIESTRWIGRSALHVFERQQPDADARLSAAPRLQPAAVRPRASRASRATSRPSTRFAAS